MMELINKNEYEKRLGQYVKYLNSKSKQDKVEEFALRRNISLCEVQKCGIFYIGEMAELLIPEFMGEVKGFGVISNTNNKPIFKDRYVIPIKTVSGNVQNLVGYSFHSEQRYIYGTAKYYSRTNTLWGLENIKLAYDLGYAILTEGITDAIRLRDMGYANTFAMCGTHKSDLIITQLNRCRHGVIRIPDRDKAGLRALEGWSFNRHVTVYINIKYKDIDEMCRESDENKEIFNSYMEDIVRWIKSGEHKGYKSLCEKITIL